MTKYNQFGIAVLIIFAVALASAQMNSYGVPALSTHPSSSFSASTAAASPDGTGSADDPILTIKKRVDEVNVLFIATDRHGKFVRNLNQTDFSFLDDHKPVQSILKFHNETDLPIEMGLLVDVSASVHSRLPWPSQSARATRIAPSESDSSPATNPTVTRSSPIG